MPRQITYSIATEFQNGFYNPTFNWGRIDAYLNFLGRYWDIQYVRVRGPGRVQINQGAENPGSGIMATTSGWITKISPVAAFGRSDYVCCKVTDHEGGHWVKINHSENPVALMSANAGTGHNLTASDYPYWPYAWKSALRPHQEPEQLLKTFPHATPKALSNSLIAQAELHGARSLAELSEFEHIFYQMRVDDDLNPDLYEADPFNFACKKAGLFSGLMGRFIKP